MSAIMILDRLPSLVQKTVVALVALVSICSAPAETTMNEDARLPRLYRVILPVHDIDKMVDFYRGLLEQMGQRVSPGRHYFDLGGTILAIYDPVADGDPAGEWKHHANQYIYIAVADVESVFGRAERLGATLVSEGVQSMPWGERLFYARDPSGNPICLVDAQTLYLGDSE